MNNTEDDKPGSLERMVRPMVTVIQVCETMTFILPTLAIERLRWEHADLPLRRPDGQTTRWIVDIIVGWWRWHRQVRLFGPVANRPNDPSSATRPTGGAS